MVVVARQASLAVFHFGARLLVEQFGWELPSAVSCSAILLETTLHGQAG